MYNDLTELGIPTIVVLDCAVGYIVEKVSLHSGVVDNDSPTYSSVLVRSIHEAIKFYIHLLIFSHIDLSCRHYDFTHTPLSI